VVKMNEQEVVEFMIEAMHEDNRSMALHGGMTEEAFDEFWNTSLPSVRFLVDSLYNKMKDKNLLA